METTKVKEIPLWVAQNILDFFNSVRFSGEITDGIIKDDPSDGPGYAIGEVVAYRILQARRSLPLEQFTDLRQIVRIPGMGADKMQDLIYSLGRTADQHFQDFMFNNGVISRDNWELLYFRHTVNDPLQFDEIVFNEDLLRKTIINRIGDICVERKIVADKCEAMVKAIKAGEIESIQSRGDLPARKLADWFMTFDDDNWFSRKLVRNAIWDYFYYYRRPYRWELELKFVKGFVPAIFKSAVLATDLPVVVNFKELTITLWMVALYD